MRFLVSHPPGRTEERAHAAALVLPGETALREEERDDVRVTLEGADGELRFADRLFPTERWLEVASLPPDGAWGDDPFGTAFVHATGYGDLALDDRDGHGRHRAPGDVSRPVVDEASARVAELVAHTWPRAGLPARGSGTTLPSHDVDWPRSPERTAAARLRRAAGAAARRDPGEAAARVHALVRRRDPNDTFDFIMDASERHGLRSAFFFIAGGTPPRDGDYDLEAPWVRALLRRIHDRGHEIGLHGSYETMHDPERLAAEFAKLRRVCDEERIEQDEWGGRQHYLRWDPASTWPAYEQAGLDYDTSAAYADRAGFRLGTSRDIQAFDVPRGRRLRLRERPLVAMEVTVLDHMRLDVRSALAQLAALKEQTRRHGGAFTLLWHNSRLVSPRERRLYEAALDA